MMLELAGGVSWDGRDPTGLQGMRMVLMTTNVWFRGSIEVVHPFTESRENDHTFGKPNWFENVHKEHLACRENVVVFDLSSFAKI